MDGRSAALSCVDDVEMVGRTVLVTGSTDGIGREAALALGHLGADVLVHGRDPAKGEAVAAALADGPGTGTFVRADFTALEAVRELATTARDYGVDVVVNNAGAYFSSGRLTDAGIERTFAVNHLAPYLLTALLAEELPADGRVVTVASGAHRGVEFDLDAVRTAADHDGLWAYRHSKLANILFTRALAARIDQPATCLHPGFVPGSALWREAPLPVAAGIAVLRHLPDVLVNLLGATPAAGAATIVYLAANPGGADLTGRYVVDCEPRRPARPARDDAAADRLWTWSADAVELAPDHPFRSAGAAAG